MFAIISQRETGRVSFNFFGQLADAVYGPLMNFHSASWPVKFEWRDFTRIS